LIQFTKRGGCFTLQIWLASTAHGSQLTIAGGTIFNGGAYQHSFGVGECAILGGCNGLIADAGN